MRRPLLPNPAPPASVVDLAIAALAFAGLLVVAWRTIFGPLDQLLLVVPDDAFYYLQIARNLVETGRSTADGFSVTNGYHPLWMAIEAVLAVFVQGDETFLRVVIGVSLVAHVLIAAALRAVVAPLLGSRWAWTTGTCWLINPLACLIALQAMESTVYIMALVAALGLHLKIAARFDRGEAPSRSQIAVYGAMLGLVVLARTEGAMAALLALAWLARRLWPAPPGSTVRTLVVCGSSMALVVAPWLIFSLWQVGTVTQDSGAMKALWASDLFPDLASRSRNLLDTIDYFLRRSLRLMSATDASARMVTLPVIVIGLLFAAALAMRWRSREGTALRAIAAPAAAAGLVYSMTMVERQVWWLGLPCLTIVLGSIVALATILRARPRLRPFEGWARVVLVAISALAFVRWSTRPLEPYPWQPDVLRSQAVIDELVPAGERIGCFNAGIPIYFGSGRIVALDGIVSHEARGWWRARRVDDFLTQARVGFIADEQLTVNRANRFASAPLALEEIRAFPLRGWPTGRRVLWKVIRARE
jgi:hypothetical protein